MKPDEPWSIPPHDVGVVRDRVHTLVALPHHIPDLKRPDTEAEFDPALGAVVIHFYGGLEDVASRLPLHAGTVWYSKHGEHRWVAAGLSNRMGMIAIVAAGKNNEASVTVVPMAQATYEAIMSNRGR